MRIGGPRGLFAFAAGGLAAGLLALGLPSVAAAAEKPSCNIASPTGERMIQLADQGADRPFLLYVPDGYKRREPVPLILNLHPSNSSGPAQMAISEFEAAADRNEYAVAAPNGGITTGPVESYAWNVPGVPLISGSPIPEGAANDEQYLLRVIKAARRSACIDKDRVYLTGYSGGARMSSQMGCDHAKTIAAIAPVGGLRAGVPVELSDGVWAPDRSTCKPDRPIPVLAFHGTDDGVNPYSGNDDPRWGYGVEDALADWARNDRCKKGPTTKPATASVDLITYGGCKGKATVSLYRQNGAGHTWPGSAGPEVGPIDQSISATDLMIRFFDRHSLAKRK